MFVIVPSNKSSFVSSTLLLLLYLLVDSILSKKEEWSAERTLVSFLCNTFFSCKGSFKVLPTDTMIFSSSTLSSEDAISPRWSSFSCLKENSPSSSIIFIVTLSSSFSSFFSSFSSFFSSSSLPLPLTLTPFSFSESSPKNS